MKLMIIILLTSTICFQAEAKRTGKEPRPVRGANVNRILEMNKQPHRVGGE